jgi:hypothetical protein
MQSSAKSPRVSQLPLFHPPSTAPHWQSLPQEVRGQTLALLVCLLRAAAFANIQPLSEEAHSE